MIETFFIFRLLTNKWKNHHVSGVFQLLKLRNMRRPLRAGSSGSNLLVVISSFLKLLRSVVSAKVNVTASTSADGAIIKVTTSGY